MGGGILWRPPARLQLVIVVVFISIKTMMVVCAQKDDETVVYVCHTE